MPDTDAKGASLIEGTKIIPITSLSQLASYFRGEIPPPEYKSDEVQEYTPPPSSATDLAYIKGQEHVKRALAVIVVVYTVFMWRAREQTWDMSKSY